MNIKVLVVDDNLTDQLFAKTMFSKLGHHVTQATDGYEAIEVAASQKFDFIIMDCHMPMLSGYQTTLKMCDRGIKTTIIGCTGQIDLEERKKFGLIGVSTFLTKHYTLDDLTVALK